MDFLQDLDIDGPEYQFMFQTPEDNPPSTTPRNARPTEAMDPYLLQRYKSDEHGAFKFKQLAIRSVNNNPPVQFLISQPSLFAQSRREAGHMEEIDRSLHEAYCASLSDFLSRVPSGSCYERAMSPSSYSLHFFAIFDVRR
ncbi:hypothetical protein F53441_4792 [Fusarium austroafricanum]|uniref:Uncharacterized protein n=1 Tax=Fusarium austroafricanum TaxID=2364996 RepID=A0A8H4NYE4_9HYPO|nr:hypothetical protein F53441_4792 [Fusarium austroafricanum]